MAERIARRVGGGASSPAPSSNTDIGSELAAMRATLNDLQNRLIQIESRVTSAKASLAMARGGEREPSESGTFWC